MQLTRHSAVRNLEDPLEVEASRLSGVAVGPKAFGIRQVPSDPSDAIKLSGTPRKKRKRRWKPKPPSELERARNESLKELVRYAQSLRKEIRKLDQEKIVAEYVIGLLTGKIEPST